MDGGVELSKGTKDAINEYLAKKNLPLDIAVTFDDVWIPEQFSGTRSRKEIWSLPSKSFRESIGKGIALNYPVLSANMISVTGLNMARAMLRAGGGYFLPQMLNLESRTGILEQIKRTDSALIEGNSVLVTTPWQKLKEARAHMERHNIWTLVVINNETERKVVGILSPRDWRREMDHECSVAALMTRVVHSVDALASLDVVKVLMRKNKIEKLPIVDHAGRLQGLYTAHGVFYEMDHPLATRDTLGGFTLFGSVRVGREITKETKQELECQAKLGVKVMLFDTARGYAINLKELLQFSAKEYPQFVNVVGNVSSAEGASALFEWGAHIVKVNQGRGSQCRTSRQTGVGQPQITAIAETSVIAKEYGGKIIADGGMKSPGDVAKAFIAGAHFVMTGSRLVGTYESPPQSEYKLDKETGKYYMVKKYEGSASLEAQKKRIFEGTLDEFRQPEGEWEYFPVVGSVRDAIPELFEVIASSMSYHGMTTLDEFREIGHFGGKLQTKAGHEEGVKS